MFEGVSPADGQAAPKRLAHLDGLRGWAALAVVCSHAILAADDALMTGQSAESHGRWDVWLSGTPVFPLPNAGNLAVCLFFGLSGLVLAHSYARSRRTWFGLVSQRFVRLVIPMLAGCIVAWALLAAGLMPNGRAALLTKSDWLQIQYHQRPDLLRAALEPPLTLLGRHFDVRTTYDASLWTMPIEALGSAILIAVFAAARALGLRSLRTAGAACACLGLLLHGYYVCLILLGAAAGLLWPSRRVRLPRPWMVLCLLLGLFLGTLPYSAARWPIYGWLVGAVLPLVPAPGDWAMRPEDFCHALGAVLVLAAVLCNAPLQAQLGRPLGQWLGRISYPLYILHLPLLMAVECWLMLAFHAWHVPGATAIIPVVTVAIIVATVSVVAPSIERFAIGTARRAGDAADRLLPWHGRRACATNVITLLPASSKNACNSNAEAKADQKG